MTVTDRAEPAPRRDGLSALRLLWSIARAYNKMVMMGIGAMSSRHQIVDDVSAAGAQ
jgi:hypothetical protein